MAYKYPDEGLDLLIAIFPKGNGNAAPPQTTYIGLFTAFTASTVGTDAQGRSAYTEPATSGTAYARQSIAAGSWGTTADSTTPTGRMTTAGQVTFTAATGSWGALNGFFIANSTTVGAGTLYYAANFDDLTAVTINTGDTIKVTPAWVYANGTFS